MAHNADILEQPRSLLPEVRDVLSDGAPGAPRAKDDRAEAATCSHCGLTCGTKRFLSGANVFCCQGCQTVFELLTANGLDAFYDFGEATGVRGRGAIPHNQFSFVDAPAVRVRLVDYSDAKLTRVRVRLPAIHCVACVWLLENLFRLRAGIGHSEVSFPRKEVAVSFETSQVKLSEVFALLASLGYEPELKLADVAERPLRSTPHRLWIQVGLAGFVFGNTMLFSIATYLGLDSVTGPAFKKLVGPLSMLLTLPVVIYSAREYWRSAWISLRQRLLNIDVPIALGILAIYLQSAWEVCVRHGEGYFDSLSGLIFFLLCGRVFQQKTFDRLAFDRDYRSFFPLSVARKGADGEERISLSSLHVGDELIVRNGELIPGDARLTKGSGFIDYSFVTGESEPVAHGPGDYVYAGGRQIGGAIEVLTVKSVSQSYLTSLWDKEAFRKSSAAESINTLTNRYSQRFTKLVIAVALGAAVFWLIVNPSLSQKAFTSVLIVACPCALALAAPFALGSALRVLARRDIYLKNTAVLERLAAADALVFDKTGTLTMSGGRRGSFHGEPLCETERTWVYSLAWHSNHPMSARMAQFVAGGGILIPVQGFSETPAAGIEGEVSGHELRAGSANWLRQKGVSVRETGGARGSRQAEGNGPLSTGSTVHLAIDGVYRGYFEFHGAVRPAIHDLLSGVACGYELSLLSGDNDRERARFRQLFGPTAQLHFNQSPEDKLKFVEHLQETGRSVVMIGDGLNDAGALKQSDVGVAVVENISAFSPASDVILTAAQVPQIGAMLGFARSAVRVVRGSFLISTLYNVVGVSIAARGLLSPVVCAILMPLSSVSVVAFACGMTNWLGRRAFSRAQRSSVRKPSELEGAG